MTTEQYLVSEIITLHQIIFFLLAGIAFIFCVCQENSESREERKLKTNLENTQKCIEKNWKN